MILQKLAANLLEDTLLYLNAMEQGAYSQPIELLSGASIGQHSRHLIEFFQCLLQQCNEQIPLVNYDHRLRDKQIETAPEFAIMAINEIIHQLQKNDFPSNLQLQSTYENDEHITLDSSFERELMYNIEHTIHHLAIIKIGLKMIAPHIELPPHFGVASSTIKYRNAVCAQ